MFSALQQLSALIHLTAQKISAILPDISCVFGNNTLKSFRREVQMRYSTIRKYPITQMKKRSVPADTESVIDISIGAAAGLLALMFFQGLLLGYVIRRRRY